jgi:hypothetical protein
VTQRHQHDRPDEVLDVDHGLVSALENVEHAVRIYLETLSEIDLRELRYALAQLDDLTAASDQWAQSMGSLGAWGYVSKEVAIGQTSTTPMIDHEGSSLFQAQVNLVQAAKALLQRPGSGSLEALRAAWKDLTTTT